MIEDTHSQEVLAIFPMEVARDLLGLLGDPDPTKSRTRFPSPVVCTAGTEIVGADSTGAFKVYNVSGFRLAVADYEIGTPVTREDTISADNILVCTDGRKLQAGVQYISWKGPAVAWNSLAAYQVWYTDGKDAVAFTKVTGEPAVDGLHPAKRMLWDQSTNTFFEGEDVWFLDANPMSGSGPNCGGATGSLQSGNSVANFSEGRFTGNTSNPPPSGNTPFSGTLS